MMIGIGTARCREWEVDMRPIDADALLDKTVHMAKECFGVGQCYCLRTQFQKMIEDALTIDAVPIVRCGECQGAMYGNEHERVVWCALCREWKSKDGFCDEGERKEK